MKILGVIPARGGSKAIPRKNILPLLSKPLIVWSIEAAHSSVLQHALEEIPADIVVLLQPTSPIRVDNIVDRAIQLFLDTECDTLATGFMSHVFEWGSTENVPRQKLQGYFHDDGNVYVFKNVVVKTGRWTGDQLLNMEVPSYYNLEIDTVTDFWANEGILRRVLDGKHRSNDA
jgi:CMP-N-acetylneuraminic acid synthetase